ncbi:MAG: hypothetical protein ACRCWG_11950 [Sarcina sp.]
MIKHEAKIFGIASEHVLQRISKDNLILKPFNFKLDNLDDISSAYEITLFTKIISSKKINIQESYITTLTFNIAAKVLYSDSYTNAVIKECTYPFIVSYPNLTKTSEILIIDCNFHINESSIHFSVLIGFVRESANIKIYKAKNYIETANTFDFDSSFDFL